MYKCWNRINWYRQVLLLGLWLTGIRTPLRFTQHCNLLRGEVVFDFTSSCSDSGRSFKNTQQRSKPTNSVFFKSVGTYSFIYWTITWSGEKEKKNLYRTYNFTLSLFLFESETQWKSFLLLSLFKLNLTETDLISRGSTQKHSFSLNYFAFFLCQILFIWMNLNEWTSKHEAKYISVDVKVHWSCLDHEFLGFCVCV